MSIAKPGRRPSISEAKLFMEFLPESLYTRRVIIHHVTEDSWNRLQLEYEVWNWTGNIEFKRRIVTGHSS